MIDVAPATRMLVLGDSHARFWNGQDNCNGADLIAGIQTLKINGALAWSLARTGSNSQGREITLATLENARNSGFQGTVMLSFGEIDIRFHILKHALSLGLAEAVRDVARRYAAFVREVHAAWPDIVLWAPPASRADHTYFHPNTPTIGAQVERNFATIFLADCMRELLADTNIPVLSLLPLLIGESGMTKLDVLYDGAHVSQTFMPNALHELYKATGLCFEPARAILALSDTRTLEFSSTRTQLHDNCEWLAIELRQSFFISYLATELAFDKVRIRTGLEIDRFELASESSSPVRMHEDKAHIEIGLLTRCIWVRIDDAAPAIDQIDVIVRASDLFRGSPGRGCTAASLFHLSNALCATHAAGALPTL